MGTLFAICVGKMYGLGTVSCSDFNLYQGLSN